MATDLTVTGGADMTAMRAPTQDSAMVFIGQLEERWRLAKMLVCSGMIPQKTPEAAMAVMLKGHELGIAPMQAAANIYFFDGKVGISADLMTALFIQRAGGRLTVKEWTSAVCTIQFDRTGWESSVISYSIEDAKEAGLVNKPNWKNKKAMLSARCRALGIRLLAPEVFAGTYSREEVEDMEPGGFRNAPSAGAVAMNAEVLGTGDSAEPDAGWSAETDEVFGPDDETGDLFPANIHDEANA